MTENEKGKEGDDLMICFVIHVGLLSLHIFSNICFTKRLVVYHPLTFELCSSWFSINHRNIDNHFTYEKVSCLKWVLRKKRHTQSLLLKYAIRRVILCLLARFLGKNHSKNTIVKHLKYNKNMIKSLV